jgi:hypothetical protein
MANVTVINHISLDGVLQAPASAEEDPRDGFEHGGSPASPTTTWVPVTPTTIGVLIATDERRR